MQTAPQNFLIRNSFPRPTFEHAIDPDAFRALEFVIIKIRIVNHFPDLADDPVLNPEVLNQCFERAIVTAMRKIGVSPSGRAASRRKVLASIDPPPEKS